MPHLKVSVVGQWLNSELDNISYVSILFISQEGVEIVTSATSILDLPIEVFHNVIFAYLEDIDIYNLGRAGSKQLEDISTAYVQLGKR